MDGMYDQWEDKPSTSSVTCPRERNLCRTGRDAKRDERIYIDKLGHTGGFAGKTRWKTRRKTRWKTRRKTRWKTRRKTGQKRVQKMSEKNEVEILRYSMFSGFQFFGRKCDLSRAYRHLVALYLLFDWRQKVKGTPFARFRNALE